MPCNTLILSGKFIANNDVLKIFPSEDRRDLKLTLSLTRWEGRIQMHDRELKAFYIILVNSEFNGM